MHTIIHALIAASSGEPVEITFTVTDAEGEAVDVSEAAATYKIARRLGDTAILTKTDADGITLSSNMAVVSFDTAEITDGEEALTGDFVAQLRITQDGDSLVVAEGPLYVAPVIV